MANFEYKLPQGTGPLKRPINVNKLSDTQKLIRDMIYDETNGLMEFANHCVYVNRNGISLYQPFDYQKEMLCKFLNYDRTVALMSRQNGKCCLKSKVYLKNKTSGETVEMLIDDFYELIKNRK